MADPLIELSAERLNRATWELLDMPTVDYIVELVRVAAGDQAWEKTRAALAKLAASGGHSPELWAKPAPPTEESQR